MSESAGLGSFRHATAAAGWLAPGELRIFDPGQEPEANAWLGQP